MRKRESTHIDLVVELTALNPDGALDEIIKEARAGEFHDYKNQKYVCGKVELVKQLSQHERCNSIRQAVMNGDYDESPDAEDKAKMRAELVEDAGSEEAAEPLLRQLGLWEK